MILTKIREFPYDQLSVLKNLFLIEVSCCMHDKSIVKRVRLKYPVNNDHLLRSTICYTHIGINCAGKSIY